MVVAMIFCDFLLFLFSKARRLVAVLNGLLAIN